VPENLTNATIIFQILSLQVEEFDPDWSEVSVVTPALSRDDVGTYSISCTFDQTTHLDHTDVPILIYTHPTIDGVDPAQIPVALAISVSGIYIYICVCVHSEVKLFDIHFDEY
jgi:hypothetical protein